MVQVQAVKSKAEINIYTLGKFYVSQGNAVISESSSRSRRMWEVFKYLLSFRDQSVNPEEILERIWPEKDYSDPGTAMRAQVFRLRQALKNEDSEPSISDNIIFSQGAYRWENKVECWIDVDQFEAYLRQADDLVVSEPNQAINLYRQAISLYKGKYLPESTYSEWSEPLRAYYHDLYLNAIYALADLLKSKRAYGDIIQLSEQASAIDYFDENIHVIMLEALIAEGQTARARAHYNEVTSAFYREMGVKPSDEMKKLYRQVGIETGSFELDLSTIQENLKSKKAVSGAYYCDPEMFRYFYKLEQLRSERNDHPVLLCLITVTASNFAKPPAEQLKGVMHNLKDVIMSSLRKGDLVTSWNEAQYLLLLPGLNREQAIMVLERIENSYHSRYTLDSLQMHNKIESLYPLEGDSHFN
jgi:two-component SAPR family response regulator